MVEFDNFGPEKILQVYNPKVGMRGFVVLDCVTGLGPGKGGIRLTPSVTIDEVAKLARTMTWKNTMADLPFGGAKAGIIGDDRKISIQRKKEIVKAFAKAISSVCPKEYIAGPDMNTSEVEMGWVAEVLGKKACTGKPKRMGGIPHELGSTGFGVSMAAKVASKYANLNLRNSTVAIEGFGNVGLFAAKHLSEIGANLIAVSDSRGVIYNKGGLDFKKLTKVKKEKGTVTAYGGKVLNSKEIISVDCDILITAAVPDLIKMGDVNKVKAKMIVEGSNIPMTAEVEKMFYKKGVLVVPDFVANAGGVISSYVEWKGGSVKEMFKTVENKIVKNTKLTLEMAKKKRINPREAALMITKERVLKKCKNCRS
ncbi:MAG: Glu/Leu/Phe/Val dehydrogenase [Candidatus Woesearchaeota archaeon]|nr:MAG: Glu/Leu/Phe/Val dehydrogenase [Candidatus Woesearchaeota archaeon]